MLLHSLSGLRHARDFVAWQVLKVRIIGYGFAIGGTSIFSMKKESCFTSDS